MSSLKYFYAYEKLGRSVEVFMTTSGKDRDKIRDCYRDHLSYLEDKELPPNCAPMFSYIKEKMTDSREQQKMDPSNRQGVIFWAATKLHASHMLKIKKYIWEMYRDVESEVRG